MVCLLLLPFWRSADIVNKINFSIKSSMSLGMRPKMLKKLSLVMSIVAAISYQTTNPPATAEVFPLQSEKPAIPVTQNGTKNDAKNQMPEVPDKLKVPVGNTLILKTPAKGVQIYTCQPKASDKTKFEWTFKAPEANLSEETGASIGKHYGGPTWEHKDGSKVVGEIKERLDSPDANAIPWLLLSAKSTEGNGFFGKVTYIQRLNTKGGKAPSTGCDVSKQNSTVRIDYTTDYYYYAAE
jgi:Protein of unknown function (DUF3455)